MIAELTAFVNKSIVSGLNCVSDAPKPDTLEKSKSESNGLKFV